MTEEERYELYIAGWLHDCGKVATPTHVVDKGTKLETIFDRIDTIDTRFEVLKRDAKIDYLQKLVNQKSSRNGEAKTAGTGVQGENFVRLGKIRSSSRSAI